jgi:hypothetical protein
MWSKYSGKRSSSLGLQAGEYEELKKHINGLTAEDMVWQPPHYTVGGYEAIEVIKAKLSPEEWRGAMKFNVLKYLMRSNYKGHHDQDCSKALFYMQQLEEALDSKQVDLKEEVLDDPPF